MTWDQVTLQDIRDALDDKQTLDLIMDACSIAEDDVLELATLEQVEDVGEESKRYNTHFHGYTSEEAAKQAFEAMLKECEILLDMDDEPMVSEAFNAWLDEEYDAGRLLAVQVNNYDYP